MKLDDNWKCVNGEVENTPFIVRYRPNLINFFESDKYHTRLEILWTYSSNNNDLMPTTDELNLMEQVEDALCDVLEKDFQAILTVVTLGDNEKCWYWYTSDLNETGIRLNKALSNFERLPIDISKEHDSKWDSYYGLIESLE